MMGSVSKEENFHDDDDEAFEPMQIENNTGTRTGTPSKDSRGICDGKGKFFAIVGTFIFISIALFSISIAASPGYYTKDNNNHGDESGSTSTHNLLVDITKDKNDKSDDDYYADDHPNPEPEKVRPTKSHNTKPNNKNSKYNKVTKEDGIMYETIGDIIYHDKHHFTQGLTYSKDSNRLYESNGLYGQSSICELDPSTGESKLCIDMDHDYFAEGAQIYKTQDGEERLIQVTWKNRIGFIYNADTLDMVSNFTFTSTRNEGWGITINGNEREFILSDGSENLHFMDMDTLDEIRRIPVIRQSGLQARNINELEYYNGKILANVWYEDVILVIDPITGVCESEYDMSMLWPVVERRKKGADVLNGISVSKEDGILYITGKKWDRMYKLKLKHLS